MLNVIESACVRFPAVTLVAAMVGGAATGQELYRDQMNSGVGWGVNASSADTAATFGYDYSADFIPEAPNTQVGDTATTGLKLGANISAPTGGEHLSVYPIGQNFTGDHRLRFDAWMNFDTDAFYNNGAAGTTEFMGGGLGYDNTSADIGPGAQVIATGDGGSGSDWRAFDVGTFLTTGEMIAGTRNGFDSYYSSFLTPVSPPAGQQIDNGPSIAGSPAFQWVTFELWSRDDLMIFSIEKPNGDSKQIVRIDVTGNETDGNIMLFYADFFSSVAAQPDLQFGLIDNVVVEVPEPATGVLFGITALAMVRRRR